MPSFSATDDAYTVHQGRTIDILSPGVLGNDSSGGTRTASLVSGVSHGTLTLLSSGRFQYRPANGYVGADSFVYRVTSSWGWSAEGVVRLTVTNAAPVAGAWEQYQTSIDTNLSVSAPGLLGNDTDADGDTLYPILPSAPPSGQPHLTGNGGKLWLYSHGGFLYKPPVGWSGVDTFDYRAWDGAEYSQPVTVQIAVSVPLPPPPPVVTITPSTQNVAEGGSGNITLTRTGSLTQALTVRVAVGHNGAYPLATIGAPTGNDATLAGTSLVWVGAGTADVTIPAGQASVSLALQAAADNLVEGAEGFRVAVQHGGTNYQGGGNAADVRIDDTTVSGIVWSDDNGDGVRGAGEQGVPGITVALKQNGVVVAQTESSYDGSYTLGAAAGSGHQVVFTKTAWQQFTLANVGSDATDSDVTGVGGTTDNFTVAGGVSTPNVDAGVTWLSSVGATAPQSSVDEGGLATFHLRRTNTVGTLVVSYSVNRSDPHTPGSQPVTSGTATFQAGEETAVVEVPVPDDSEYVYIRTLTLQIDSVSDPLVVVSQPTAAVRVYDDEAMAEVWIDSADYAYEGQTAEIRLRRNFLAGGLTVTYQLDPSVTTATESQDFDPLAGTAYFAPGEEMIVIPINTLPDALGEASEFVAVKLLGAVRTGAFATPWSTLVPADPVQKVLTPPAPHRPPPVLEPPVGVAPKAEIRDGQGPPKPQNAPPVFAAQQPNPFVIGVNSPKSTLVGVVTATDPNPGDKITYSLSDAPNFAGWAAFFEVNRDTGRITVKSQLLSSMPGTIKVRVTASDGKATATMDAEIALKPLVVLTGDIHAVEGTDDTARVYIYRLTQDRTAALTVKVNVTWGGGDFNVTAADLTNPANLGPNEYSLAQLMQGKGAGTHELTLTIPAGSDHVTIIAKAAADGVSELPESVKVELVTPAATAGYITLANLTPADPDRPLAHAGRIDHGGGLILSSRGTNVVKVTILDGVRLFAPLNRTAALQDDNLTGLHYNDVRQGYVGDCWLMASAAAFAKANPLAFSKRFVERADGKVDVYLYNENGQHGDPVVVDLTVVAGMAQATIDSATDYLDGKLEIWVNVLEKAYQQKFGSATMYTGENPGVTLARLTGTKTWQRTADQFDAAFLQTVYNKAGTVPMVFTRAPGDTVALPNTTNGLPGNHAFAVIGSREQDGIKYIQMYNPWGETVDVRLDKLSTYFAYANGCGNAP